MEITVRPATAGDVNFCCQTHHLAYRDVVERQFGGWDESLQDGFFAKAWDALHFQIIESDDHPAGCFCCERQQEQILLLEIFLLPAYQGSGIGSELIRREQCAATKLGIPIRLRVLKANQARRLYQRLGFRETGEDTTHFLMEWRA